MTREQMLEDISKCLYGENEPTLIYDGVSYELCKDIYIWKVESYREQAKQILSLFESSGWKSPEELRDWVKLCLTTRLPVMDVEAQE